MMHVAFMYMYTSGFPDSSASFTSLVRISLVFDLYFSSLNKIFIGTTFDLPTIQVADDGRTGST